MKIHSARSMLLASGVVGTLLACSTSKADADPCKAPLPPPGTAFHGVVTYIVDGDGLCVGKDRGGIEVRLADFNAIELRDPGGKKAKEILASIALGKEVFCIADHQSFDRIVAACQLNGRSLGDLMRESHAEEGGN